MKKLIPLIYIILLVFMITEGCKKKDTEPQTQEPEKVCTKQSEIFIGKYQTYNTLKKDTITIVFTKVNCPDDNSNQYTIKGLYKAISNYSATHLTNRDYIINSNEKYKSATGDNSIECGFPVNNNTLQFACDNPKISLIFVRI